MDTSEVYVKMADCEEVQGQKDLIIQPYRDGNFYWDKTNKKIRIDSCYGDMDSHIFLPRQDQIQEMLDFAPATHWAIDFVVEIYGYIEDGHRSYLSGCMKEYYQQFQSWEQLWLVFYMHEKHGKTWDGEMWN